MCSLFRSLGPGSAVGEKGKKQGQIGKKKERLGPSVVLGRGKGRHPQFPSQITSRLASLADFFSFSPNVEPGPRLSFMTLTRKLYLFFKYT